MKVPESPAIKTESGPSGKTDHSETRNRSISLFRPINFFIRKLLFNSLYTFESELKKHLENDNYRNLSEIFLISFFRLHRKKLLM